MMLVHENLEFTIFQTASKYTRMCQCSNDTSQRDIRALIEKGVLEQNLKGGSKTSYRIRELELKDMPVL